MKIYIIESTIKNSVIRDKMMGLGETDAFIRFFTKYAKSGATMTNTRIIETRSYF